jgi:hypothetical protein
MFHILVQQHSLRHLFLGDNKFDVTTLPAIVPTMTKIEKLNISDLGYTGVLLLDIQTAVFCLLHSDLISSFSYM